MDKRQVPVANVSVIIPTFNNVGTIGRAIKSAQSQTLHNIEIVIVDDASTDGTYDLASSLAATDPRIKLTRLRKNVGAGGARNTALDMASYGSPFLMPMTGMNLIGLKFYLKRLKKIM